jgi:hypothetical protein
MGRKFSTYEIQTGNVFLEATVKVRVQGRHTLNLDTDEEYLLDALYAGDIEVIETKVDTFEVTDVETEIDIHDDY